jgi:alpha-N-arabinofuranosidase
MDTVNSFDKPNGVVPQAFTGATLSGNGLTVTLPPKSVVMLDLK